MAETQIEDFEIFVDKHSLCPLDIQYNALALVGEAGEVANAVKKMKMCAIRPNWISHNDTRLNMPTPLELADNVIDEMGDMLFYMVAVCKTLNVDLHDVMQRQAEKLIRKSMHYQTDFLK